MAAKGRTARYYANNPKAKAKKYAYDKRRNATSKSKNYRAELARARRKRGMMGNGGADLSHTKNGKLVKEAPSKNRARNGANGKSTKK